MEDPVFTAELNVSQGSSYGAFISGVRNQLLFGVTLRCSSGEFVLLRVRGDNLYISGYRSPAGRWWEFRGGSVIGAATQLAFTDNYGSMGKAAESALKKVTLGKPELEAAVRQLAAAGDNANAAGVFAV